MNPTREISKLQVKIHAYEATIRKMEGTLLLQEGRGSEKMLEMITDLRAQINKIERIWNGGTVV